jgi:hypothetical protein
MLNLLKFACSEYLLVFVSERGESYLDLLNFGGSKQLMNFGGSEQLLEI